MECLLCAWYQRREEGLEKLSLVEETDMTWALYCVMGAVPQAVSIKDKPKEVGWGL